MVKWTEISSSQIDELKAAAQELQVHPLALEDCLHRDQRPKLDDYDTHKLLVWFFLCKDKMYEIQFLIFQEQILMVPHSAPPQGSSWKEYLKINDSHKDAWHMLYQALDKATDITWQELRILFQKVDDFEQKMFKKDLNPQSLLRLKKRMNEVDSSIGHLSSVAEQIQDMYQLKDDLNWKWRDLVDHCERISHSINLYRSQITSTIELYWGLEANRTNRQIKKLSILASIAVPMTFWASVWGMNFEMIPFSNPQFFYGALLLMFISVGVTVWLLMKRGYLND